MQRPTLWDNPDEARRLGRELSTLQTQLEDVDRLSRRIEDLSVLLALAEEHPEGVTAEDLAGEARAIQQELDRLEQSTLLREPHDAANAILAIHGGAGGTEAADWAEMLLRMYLRWAESRDYATEIADLSPGEEAGIKSVTVIVQGPKAYGHLRGERGVHRLVGISPFAASPRPPTPLRLAGRLRGERPPPPPPAGTGGEKEARATLGPARRAQGRSLGQPDPLLCPASLSDGEGPPDRPRGGQRPQRARRRPRPLHRRLSPADDSGAGVDERPLAAGRLAVYPPGGRRPPRRGAGRRGCFPGGCAWPWPAVLPVRRRSACRSMPRRGRS